MLTFTYTFTLHDQIQLAYHKACYDHQVQKKKLIFMVGIPLVCCICLILLQQPSLPIILVFLLCSIVWLLVSSKLFQYLIHHIVQRETKRMDHKEVCTTISLYQKRIKLEQQIEMDFQHYTLFQEFLFLYGKHKECVIVPIRLLQEQHCVNEVIKLLESWEVSHEAYHTIR